MPSEAGARDGRIVPTKTSAGKRRVRLSGEAVRVLREQLLARVPNELGLVFPTPGGSLWRKDNFMARVFRPAVRRGELAPLRFHDLRHTYAALMVAAGAHPKLLQAQLGHTSINVTLNTYGHLFPDAFAGVGPALDRLVETGRGEAYPDVGRGR
jgi:integrase